MQAMPLRFQWLWSSLGIGFVLLVIYLSLAPAPPDFGMPGGLDFGHVIAYFWLMIWFAQIHRSNGRRLALGTAFCVLGVALEFVQGMTDYRTFEYEDMARNFAGVVLGLVLSRTPLQDGLRAFERMFSVR